MDKKESKYYTHFLHRHKGEGPNQWYLDPYGCGCAGGCLYCYARDILSYSGNWSGTPKPCSGFRLTKEISGRVKPGDYVRLGTLSDPFQPMEDRLGLTRRAIKALVEKDIPHLIVTKYAGVASDDMIGVYDKRLTSILVTITSTAQRRTVKYEGGSSFRAKTEAIAKLRGHGINVGIRLSPYIPDFVDSGLLDIDRLNAVDCSWWRVEFLRMSRAALSRMRGIVDTERYCVRCGNDFHLPVDVKMKYLGILLSRKRPDVTVDFTAYPSAAQNEPENKEL